MREKISACITAGNEENNIRKCLESIKWTDEIVVVDSFSTDSTVDICKEYTDKVYKHQWLGYIGQKNLIKDLASCPWILFIDADEEISHELRDEILAEFESESSRQYAGYEFPRMVRYLERWITHGDWYPDIKLRLFRKAVGKCGGREPHDTTTVTGAVKRLRGHMHHYTYGSITDQITTLDKFSTITSEGWFQEKKPFRYSALFFRPALRFIRCYFLKRGFMDGLPGFIIACSSAYSVLIKYAKLWELYLNKKNTQKSNNRNNDKDAQ